MTEYEFADLLVSNSLAMVETVSIYVSLMAAYLVAIYLAGHKLNRLQVVTDSTLYVGAASVITWATYS